MRIDVLTTTALALTLAALPAAADPGRPFTARDLVTLDRLSDPAVSPDGATVAFTIRHVDLAKNHAVHTVETAPITSPGQATTPAGAAPDSHDPAFAADGKSLYVLSKRAGSSQVWRLSLAGAPATQVTKFPLDVDSFRVVPGGHALVVSMQVFPDTDQPDATRNRLDANAAAGHSTGQVYDRLFVRHWDAWADGTRDHLFAVPLNPDGTAAAAATPLMPGFDGDVPSKPFGDRNDYTVSPDGRTAFFSARLAGRTEPWSTNFDVFAVPMDASSKPRDLTARNLATDSGPVVSPDGRWLAWRAMKRPTYESDRYGVMLLDLRHPGRAAREIDPDWDRSAQSLVFSADGKRLFVTAEDVQQDRIFAIDVKSGDVTPITADGHASDVALAGSDLVYASSALTHPAELFRVPQSGGTPVQLTDVGRSQLAGVAIAPWHSFTFRGWRGDVVHGIVVEPDNLKPGQHVPVAFLIHGGPQGSFGNTWSHRWNPQFYSGLGYASVMIDFHGSTGYGQKFTDSISNHWGDRPLIDLQKGWQAALDQFPFLDGDRACALGASFGGFMVNWIAGNWNGPWKCLVTHDGVFDDRMMGFSTDELWFSEWEHGGPGTTPWADPAAYEKFNPAAHVADWRDPQLIIHGGRDYRIPIEQGLGAFDALQRRGIDSRLLVFPDESHWVLKPANSLQWHEVVADWLQQHLGK